MLLVGFLGLPAGRIGGLLWGLVGISWWVAVVLLLLSLDVRLCGIGGLCLIFAVRTCFDYSRWLAKVC